MERKVPELSLLSFTQGNETERAQFVDKLFSGIKEYGFIILTNHNVNTTTIKESYKLINDFFKLPTETKQKFNYADGAGQRGYTAFGVEHAKNTDVPDLKEFWHVGREVEEGHKYKNFYLNNVWPEKEVPGFTKALSDLYNSLDDASNFLLDALGIALDLPRSYFREMIYEGNSILRPIYYPPVAKDIPAGAVRAAAHEDINLITILMGATASGLQLLDRDGQWLDVQTKEGQLVVDSGDMLSRITNDIIPATTHRVINPEDSSSERFSMPFFVHPHPEAILECIPSCAGDGAKYQPVNSHEFLMQRLKAIGL